MANGDLHSGTRVMFVRESRTPSFQTARAFDIARVVRPLDLDGAPTPDDRFEIEYRGERLVVRRGDIAPAPNVGIPASRSRGRNPDHQ